MNHPLSTVLESYALNWSALREQHQDLNDLSFNTNYGLQIRVPRSWPTISVAKKFCGWANASLDKRHILVIYPSTPVYSEFSKELDAGTAEVSYFAWHELYVAMMRAPQDTRPMKELRARMESADVVLFLGFSEAVPDVLDQVRGLCAGCLILLE